MTDSLTQRMLRAVMGSPGDGDQPDDELVDEIAASPEAQAEAVRLAGVLAQLPGEGARDAEARLDQLLDAVSLVAVGHVIAATVPSLAK